MLYLKGESKSSQLVWAAVTNCQKLSGLNNKHLPLTVLEAGKLETKGPADLVTGEGLPVSTFLLCPYLVESTKRESSSIFLNEHKSHHGGSTLITSSKPNFLTKATPPKAIPFGYQHVGFENEGENTNMHTSVPLFPDKIIFSGNSR